MLNVSTFRVLGDSEENFLLLKITPKTFSKIFY